MRFRALAVVPFLISAALAAVVLAVPGAHAHEIVLRVENETLKGFAVAGGAIGALAFERGEYLRRAWGLQAACYALLLLRDLTFLFVTADALLGIHVATIQAVMVLAANLASVLGIWLMARATSEAGIELPGSPHKRRIAFVVAAIVAIGVSFGALRLDLKDLTHGSPGAIVAVASDVGDVLSMAFIAPVVMTAFAMRGGVLRWPWGLFGTSLVMWLFYDAARSIVGADIDEAVVSVEFFRALACTFTFVAGIAQRWAVELPAEPSAAPSAA